MEKNFLKSNKGSVSLETAFMVVVLFPALYFMVTIFGMAYVYTGKAIETTNSVANVINNWDKWRFDKKIATNSFFIGALLDNINSATGPSLIDSKVPVYNNGNFKYRIYAGFISGKTLTQCAIFKSLSSDTNLFKSDPALDVPTLSVDGPVWIVQSSIIIRKQTFTHTTVRRPSLQEINFLDNKGNSFKCSAGFTPRVEFSL